MDLLNLGDGWLRPPSVSKCGSQGCLQNLFTVKIKCPLDWFTANAKCSHKDVEADLKVNTSFLPSFDDVQAPAHGRKSLEIYFDCSK